MKTDNGTLINKVIPVLNQYVNFSSRPSIKKYRNYLLPRNFWEKEEGKLLFQNLVKFILKNDMPIMLDIEGTPHWENKPIRHAVVISVMFISDNLNNTIYYVKVPGDINITKNFRGSNLIFNFVENSWWSQKPLSNKGFCKNSNLIKSK